MLTNMLSELSLEEHPMFMSLTLLQKAQAKKTLKGDPDIVISGGPK